MKRIYNLEKLTENAEEFHDKKVAIVGGGAVGSYVAEFLSKMQVGKLIVIDFDEFTRENAAKHSCLVRVPEDTGKNKAVTVAKRAETIMIDGGKAVGIDSNITMFGPMAFSEVDIVILALDNYAAKIYFNQIWLQIPENKRPLLIFGGTFLETAQSNCLDGKDACLRCLLDESWLDEPERKTGCSGPQYRVVDGVQKIVRTSGLASSMSAHLMAESVRGYCLGIKDIVNKRLAYSPYPNLELHENTPMKRKRCLDCHSYHPSKKIEELNGNIYSMTLKVLFEQLEQKLHTKDFEVNFHVMEFAKVSYGGVITSGNCHACGKKLDKIYRHESRTYFEDIICDECKANKREVHRDDEYPTETTIHGISPVTADEKILQKTLFELGWPIGGFIHVVKRGEKAIDRLDDNVEMMTFYCPGDIALLDTIQKIR